MNFATETWTAVANRALASLGREPLVDIDQEGSDAELVRQSLPEAVGVCAGWFDWSFLRTKAKLSKDASAYEEDFSYSYSLPSDAMRVQKIDTYGYGYMIYGNKICTESESCAVTYMKLPAGPIFSAPAWNAAVQHYLAFLLAKTLTGNEALMNMEYQLFNTWISNAMANDRAILEKTGEKWWGEMNG